MAYITCFDDQRSVIANTCLAIARLGGDVRLVSKQLDQQERIDNIRLLEQQKVDTSLVSWLQSADQTTVFTSLEIKDQWFMNSDVFHFSVNSLVERTAAAVTVQAIEKAKKQGNLVSFDLSTRAEDWPEGEFNIESVETCFGFVDVVRLSKRSLELFGMTEIEFVKSVVSQGVKLVIITDGAEPTKVVAKGIYSEITPPNVNLIDASLAGEAFIGAFLFALVEQGDVKKTILDQQKLEELTLFASRCAAYTVSQKAGLSAMPALDDIAL